MLEKLIHCALLISLLGCCFVLVSCRSYNNGLIFYDIKTSQAYLPPTVSVSRGRILANVKFSEKGSIWSTFGQPCECVANVCGCCAGIKVKQYKFDQKMCANVTFMPNKEEARLDVYLNGKPSSKYGISARNPSPFCIPVMMGIPMAMCVQLSDIAIKGNNLNMCMDFVVRLATTDLFEMHFQCMKMGLDGFQYLDKNGQPVIPPSSNSKNELETTTIIHTADASNDYDYYGEAEEAEASEVAASDSENENVGYMQTNESENEKHGESAPHKIDVAATAAAASVVAEQQQKIKEQMQQLQQQLQQPSHWQEQHQEPQPQQQQQPSTAALQANQPEMEIEDESEMSTAGSVSNVDEDAMAGSTVANEPQLQNDIIGAITTATATATAPATTMIPAAGTETQTDTATASPGMTTTISSMPAEMELEQMNDAVTDTIMVAATTATMSLAAEATEINADDLTATTTATTNVIDDNSHNDISLDNADNASDNAENKADNEVDTDAAEEEYDYVNFSASDADKQQQSSDTSIDTDSVNNESESVSEMENLATEAGVSATTQAAMADVATEHMLTAMAMEKDNENVEVTAGVTDAAITTAEQKVPTLALAEAHGTTATTTTTMARKIPRTRLARYRYVYG